jgi:hypothetical protein
MFEASRLARIFSGFWLLVFLYVTEVAAIPIFKSTTVFTHNAVGLDGRGYHNRRSSWTLGNGIEYTSGNM